MGIRALLYPTPTLPMLNDNKSQDKKDCETKDVEISDTNSKNIVGGSPNPPDPDDEHNNKNSDKELPKTREEVRDILTKQGFTRKPDSPSGYEQWIRKSDSSTVWIKPSGEVIRTKRVWRQDGLRKYNERQDWWGKRLEDQSHSTGHFVK
ncbi:hypothetical protein ABV523_18725 [Snodgrassella alvi]|uniref:hypothetical protein n=1 Tax=Snodgrassella alvi TaxID=1196083 RepID=UPI0034E85414